jgi:D-xylose 1-dehydrogenase (NADP+, D-xylono-1,5-lactone-forming)
MGALDVRWGMMATGQIADLMAASAQPGRFVAVASRSADRARVFADKHGIERSYGDYQELLDDQGIDAVYIALPVAQHSEWTVKALQAGKHVLCEKPLAVDAVEVAAACAAAAAADKLCVEGLMWRWHPQTRVARDLIANGAIGTLRSVRAALTVPIPPDDIRRSRELGGGALGDLGCYCVSAIRLFAGQPEEVYAVGLNDDEDVEMRVSATARHPGGVLSQFDIGFDMSRRDQVELVGTEGHIVVTDPWLCGAARVELVTASGSRDVAIDSAGDFALTGTQSDVYRVELETVSNAIAGVTDLEFGRQDAVDQIAAIAAVRKSIQTGNAVQL